MIFLEIFSKNNVAEIVNIMSTCTYIYMALAVLIHSTLDIINHSAGLITAFHILDAAARRMFTPCNEIAYAKTNSNRISCILCSG